MSIAEKSFTSASRERLHNALSGWGGTIIMFAPFLAVGSICAALHKQERFRSAFLIFAVGLIPLIYFYFEGYQGAQQALADARWTAAALSIGLLPFFIGLPVVLFALVASVIVVGLKKAESE